MRGIRSCRLAFLALLTAILGGLLHGQSRKDPEQERIDALVRQLSDSKYRNREAALRDLIAIGEKALPSIRQAQSSPDLDASTLARQVARHIIGNANRSKTTGMEFAVIDEGRFLMGSPRNETSRGRDENQHPVRITQPFLLGRYEVTQEEYMAVMKYNPSWLAASGGGRLKVEGFNTAQFPVERVSWFDAIEFCNRLSKLDGYEPYYEMADAKTEDNSILSATVKIRGGSGYRLPTEAEWEYACRAWTITSFHFGTTNSGKDANTRPGPSYGYGGGPNWTALGRTAKVGSYKPNHRELFDMHGNVAEWCWDWYDKDYYDNSPADDPPGPKAGTHRILRGGSWMVQEGSCRSAARFMQQPGERKEYAGFRVARSP